MCGHYGYLDDNTSMTVGVLMINTTNTINTTLPVVPVPSCGGKLRFGS